MFTLVKIHVPVPYKLNKINLPCYVSYCKNWLSAGGHLHCQIEKNYRKNNNVECSESLKFLKTSYQGFGPVCTLAKLSALYAIVAGLDTNHSAIAFVFELSAMMFLATDNAQILV